MALNQNQFSMSTLVGTLDAGSGAPVITCEFYSATSTDVVVPGEMVILAATTAGLSADVPHVVKGSALTDKYFGVVLTNPLKDSYAVGDKLEVAFLGAIVQMTASAAIVGGATVQYDPATAKVATQTASNTKVGIALESVPAANGLVRILINSQF